MRMLDTNALIYARSGRHDALLRRIAEEADRGGVCISDITLAELEFGVYNSSRPEENQLALIVFLSPIAVAPFDDGAAIEFGKIRAGLKKGGCQIGACDMLIAAHAKSMGVPLVTHNVREFGGIEGLVVEDWVEEGA